MKSTISRIVFLAVFLAFIICEIFACEENFDEENCVFTAFCTHSIRLGEQLNFHDANSFSCDKLTTFGRIEYNGIMSYPIYVTCTNLIEREIVTVNRYSSLITILNLNNNFFVTTPTIPELDNLAWLKLSNCSLYEAKLSNENELKSLISLDLSHNNISSIYYDNDNYVYAELETLDLSHNSLESLLDAIFDPFTKLTSLDLSYNNIQNLNMLTFEGIKDLRYLNISKNNILDINGSLFRFSQLTELNLSNNKLTSILRKDFDKLNKLEKLDLHMNSISNLESNIFDNMISLMHLDISRNNLEILEKDMFRNTLLLQNVDLSNNNLRHLESDLFKTKELYNFNIDHNQLQGSLVRGMFEGLKFVTEMDISHQNLTAVEDFALMGLDTLVSLFLNNNNISYLAKNCFSGMNNLKTLDLSSNSLTNFDFNNQNLQNLRSLELKNNRITKLCESSFLGMNRLQYIDLFENHIAKIETLSFANLRDLIELEISNNPLQGELTEKTFEGLSSLPTLDISNTQITIIRNSSFYGMIHLKFLNLSHSNIEDINYNAFLETKYVEILDLSHNKLTVFFVNFTDLRNLKVLILSFNNLELIHDSMLPGLTSLNKLFLNNNRINVVEENTFTDLNELYLLDLSFNAMHTFNVSVIKNVKTLTSLHLSHLTSKITFAGFDNLTIADLRFTHSELRQVNFLNLVSLKQLKTVILTNDKICNISAMDFSGVKNLGHLDLSYNNINFIQPGSFRNNYKLYFLNISHNHLSKIGYGVFPGLFSLQTIDISFNNINNLRSEGFYDLKKLKKLIVDHNRITSFYPEDFSNKNLEILSIGENPIPCELLISLQTRELSFKITAVNKNEYSDENVNGVTCNIDKHIPNTTIKYNTSVGSDKILLNIRDILFNISLRKVENFESKQQSLLDTFDRHLNEIHNDFNNITSQIEISNNYSKSLKTITEIVSNMHAETEIYLAKIVKLLASSNSIKTPPPIILSKENSSIETVMSYIGKVKSELENKYAINKDNIEDRIKLLEIKVNSYTTSSATTKEKLLSSEKNNEKSSVFTETCVALTLLVVLCLVLIQLYKSRMLTNSWRSMSTRQIAESMENSQM